MYRKPTAARSRVWAITTYFPFDDPITIKRRLKVYREFRRALQVPLVTVELSLGNAFDLVEDDADVLLQVSHGDLMWQKERLLNLALQVLPDYCDTVAWIDGDIVMARPDWAGATREKLQDCRLVQPFQKLYFLRTDKAPVPAATLPVVMELESFAFRFERGDLPEGQHRTVGAALSAGLADGMVFAASRDLLERHGFYDAAIVGSANKLMLSAACGGYQHSIEALHLTGPRMDHFAAWAQPFAGSVEQKLGFIEGDIYHLWHGELSRRQYLTRHRNFQDMGFDPSVDIALNAGGAWVWNTNKPAMHEVVRELFDRRRQGPETPEAASAAPDPKFRNVDFDRH